MSETMRRIKANKHLIIGAVTVGLLGWIGILVGADGAPKFLRRLTNDSENQRSVPFGNKEPEFTFVRAVYNGLGGWGYYKSWATDWPKADRQFILGVKRLTNIKIADQEKTVPLTDEEVFRYPFLYAVEVGHMDLSDAEVRSLREYLRR